MSASRTLYICKAICWHCKKEFKAAYVKWTRNEKQCIVAPGNFSKEEKTLAAENGVVIKTVVYPNDDVYTVNVCPHCNKPYSNNRIDEFVGHEGKEIVTLNQGGKRMFLNKEFEYAGTIGKLECEGKFKGIYIIVRPENMQDIHLYQTSEAGKYKGKDPTVKIEKLKQKLLNEAEILYLGNLLWIKQSAGCKSKLAKGDIVLLSQTRRRSRGSPFWIMEWCGLPLMA